MRHKTNEAKTSIRRRKIVVSACAIGYLLIFALLAIIYHEQLTMIVQNPEGISEWISSFGFAGRLVFVLLTALQVMLGIIHDGPMQIAAGYAFGTVEGVILFMIGTVAGSAVAFILARKFGRAVLKLFFAEDKYEKFFTYIEGRNLYILASLLYFVPGTPKDMLTYCFGATRIKMPYFLLIVGLARTPAVLLTVMIAQNIISQDIKVILSIISALALLYFIGIIIRKYLLKKKENRSSEL